MARFNYFNDAADGTVTRLTFLSTMDNKEFAARFPGMRGMASDGYNKRVGHTGNGMLLPITRAIEMKPFPSKHQCNAKCLNGRHNGRCECQCGGKNHGRGMFTSLPKVA